VKSKDEKETTDDIQGKVLIHMEYTLLKLLEGERGVVQQHGLYRVRNSCDERLIVYMIELNGVLHVSFYRTLQKSMKKSNCVGC
jgi:hypothetical protein